MDEASWQQVRRDFPATEQMAYLNSAASGPMPKFVAEAPQKFYQEMMESGDRHWEEWRARREATRVKLAKMINAEPGEIGFTTNTSAGMNLIADALEGGGEVISCELEFPVSTIPWMHRGIPVHLTKTPDGELHADRLCQAMTNKTGTLVVSHVQYSNGARAPIEEIGARKGSHTLVVNVSQSAGVLPIDVRQMRIDALCATGHKWMLSGYGSGFVYMSRELLTRTRPRQISWMSVENPFAMRNDEFVLRRDMAARTEIGVPHFAGIFALGASVDYLMKLGISNIQERALAVNRHLTASLADAGWKVLSPLRDEATRSAETLVELKNPAQVMAHLSRRGVAVTQKPEGIRIATHFFNNETDIRRLIQALNEARQL